MGFPRPPHRASIAPAGCVGGLLAAALILSAAPLSEAAASRDLDRDGLSNRYELKRSHTRPRRPDTDRDKLRDGFEVRRSHTDPRSSDTDADGLRDGYEVRRSKTSPLRKDTDGDGISDGLELLAGTDPLKRGKRKGQLLPPPDSTPPDTTITSGPSGTVATGEATFEFSSSEAGSSFECRLDGAAWAKCASPRDESGLANGSHTFDVRATDAAANTDTSPATRTWMVATTTSPEPPTASFTWTPHDPQNPPVALTFTSTGACPATPCTYEWRQGPPGSELIGTGPSSSWTYLSTGTKTVVLRVTDTLGRYAEATNSFSVSSSPTPPPGCSNGQDDDGDGKVDYPADPGCMSATDDDEADAALPPTPSSTCSLQPFCGDFETGDLSQWTYVPMEGNATITVNTDQPVKQGAYSAKFVTGPQASGAVRAELGASQAQTGGYPGQEWWYGWWSYFPSAGNASGWWSDGGDFNDIAQFQSVDYTPFIYLGVDQGNYTPSSTSIFLNWGKGGTRQHFVAANPIQYDHWYHFVLHAKWSTDPSVGFIELDVDGVNRIAKTFGATLYNTTSSSIPGATAPGVYAELDLYHGATPFTNMVVHDGFCRGAIRVAVEGC